MKKVGDKLILKIPIFLDGDVLAFTDIWALPGEEGLVTDVIIFDDYVIYKVKIHNKVIDLRNNLSPLERLALQASSSEDEPSLGH